MLKRLQQKWKVSTSQFILILCVFAITGTTTAWVSKAITNWVGFTDETFWLWKVLLRLSILIFGYQAILLPVAFVFGQFPFFWKYEKKILKHLGIPIPESNEQVEKTAPDEQKINATPASPFQNTKIGAPPFTSLSQISIAIFASGTGSNAQKIIDYFRNHPSIHIALIVCNKPDAGVLRIAEKEMIPYIIIKKDLFFNGGGYVNELKQYGIQWIVLAGFLWKIPSFILEAFPNKILNIHPALLPKHGGKGMYGHFVHEAVIAAKEKESGITIHYVDEYFDNGKPVFQKTCPVEPNDTPENLAKKVQALEHQYYPEIIEKVIRAQEEI